jgi:hypothetical protein
MARLSPWETEMLQRVASGAFTTQEDRNTARAMLLRDREIKFAPVLDRVRHRPRFFTDCGPWDPPSVGPAGQLLMLAFKPGEWLPLDEADRIGAVRESLRRTVASASLVDPRLADVFAMARNINAPGISLERDRGCTWGLLRLGSRRLLFA